MASMSIVFLVLTLLFPCESSSSGVEKKARRQLVNIAPGSSLSPTSTTQPHSWASPSGEFEFGFYQEQDGFAIGIWIVGDDEKTVVWTANRDDHPLVTANARLVFSDEGKLVLIDEQGQELKLVAGAANTTQSASSAIMRNDGNFVLLDKNVTIWESFGHPTDTIMGGQILSTGASLYLSSSEVDHSTGRFRLSMQQDGNLVLYPIDIAVTPEEAYWASNTWANETRYYELYLNNTGDLVLINRSNSVVIKTLYNLNSASSNKNTGVIYRATLDADGIFRMYSHTHDENGKLIPSVVWSALSNPCEAHGFCGFNSFCTLYDAKPNCLCLPGTDYASPNDRTIGCLRNYSVPECRDGKEHVSHYSITKMENILWADIRSMGKTLSGEECSKSCLEDCNCEAAIFNTDGFCAKMQLPLRFVRRDLTESTMAFFKVAKESTKSNFKKPKPKILITKKDMAKTFGLASGFFLLSGVALAIFGFYVFKIRVLRYKRLMESGTSDTSDDQLILRVFSYNDLKRATNSFKEELGKGSFGAVYKGALNKGRKLIAVKRLEKLVEDGEREFRAEMRAIGRTNHKNVVRLLGYCPEGSNRLLVYEYMSNGSLADLLFKNVRRPNWDERIKIAVDIAKGILYLHEECKTPIIHCDIKPLNVLMDDFWAAKISGLGLAKFLMPDQIRTFTGARGTRGYVVPEWRKNVPISVKADVYSYGIMLLEIICCRRNMDANVSSPEEIVLANWVYNCFVARELNKFVVDHEEVDMNKLESMVKVGLWCVQDEPALRPSMKSVVLMLEGITDICVPPCPSS